jgi:hypothetical protein
VIFCKPTVAPECLENCYKQRCKTEHVSYPHLFCSCLSIFQNIDFVRKVSDERDRVRVNELSGRYTLQYKARMTETSGGGGAAYFRKTRADCNFRHQLYGETYRPR